MEVLCPSLGRDVSLACRTNQGDQPPTPGTDPCPLTSGRRICATVQLVRNWCAIGEALEAPVSDSPSRFCCTRDAARVPGKDSPATRHRRRDRPGHEHNQPGPNAGAPNGGRYPGASP